MNRRGFLGSILALGAAPAIVKVANLMPVRSDIIYTLPDILSVNPLEISGWSGGIMQLYVNDAAIALANAIDRNFDRLIAELYISSEQLIATGGTLALPRRT